MPFDVFFFASYLGDTAGAVNAANELVVAATVLVASVVSSLAGLLKEISLAIEHFYFIFILYDC